MFQRGVMPWWATSRLIGILLTLNFNVILICGDAILASAAQKLHIWVVFSEIVRVGREVRRPPSEFAYFGPSAESRRKNRAAHMVPIAGR